MDIAALMNPEGKTCGLEQNGVIKVFSGQNALWVLQRERPYEISGIDTIDAMRRYLYGVGNWLNCCRHFVVKRMRGVHLAALEEFRLSFWEIEGFPKNYFDHIRESQSKEVMSSNEPAPILPVEQEPNHFFVDLTEVMNHKTSQNSREILEPFLTKTRFNRLEIQCTHMPKWLENELPGLQLRLEAHENKDGVKILLFPASLP